MRRTAFTLIELLVVMGTIALLTGILLPVLRTVRQQARSVTCASNLNQLFLALTTYDQENETFPYGFKRSELGQPAPIGGFAGDHSYDRRGWWWFHFLAPSLGKNHDKGTIFWCPARSVEDGGMKPNILCGNYGVNRAICKDTKGTPGSEVVGIPLSAHQVQSPQATLLISDSGYSLISWRAATSEDLPPIDHPNRQGSFYLPGLGVNKGRTLTAGSEQDAVDGRHPNRSVNAVFADGHQDTPRADVFLVEKTGDNYVNRCPLWLPKPSEGN
ncbi:MAG TPA: type II secretion system protein [Sedimentisphaerales bacterium]|nr:type II secretion system protein [Sedimentisphaerales bacterium]